MNCMCTQEAYDAGGLFSHISSNMHIANQFYSSTTYKFVVSLQFSTIMCIIESVLSAFISTVDRNGNRY